MNSTKEHLKNMIRQPGLSGFESPIREVIRSAWQPLVDEISISPLGSLHGHAPGAEISPRTRASDPGRSAHGRDRPDGERNRAGIPAGD